MVTHSELTPGLSISVVPQNASSFPNAPSKDQNIFGLFLHLVGALGPTAHLDIVFVCFVIGFKASSLSLSLFLLENWHPPCSSKKQIGPYFFEKQNLAHFIISLEFGQDYRSKVIYLVF